MRKLMELRGTGEDLCRCEHSGTGLLEMWVGPGGAYFGLLEG